MKSLNIYIQDSDGGEEAENTSSAMDPAVQFQDRFGGIYLGDDVEDEADGLDEPFQYTIHLYGDGKKGKKAKQPAISDESRHLKIMSEISYESLPPESNMKMTFFDVDDSGYKYQKNENLLSGLDRLNHNPLKAPSSLDASSGIYLGDTEASVPFSEHRPPEYPERSFEEFAPYLSGVNRELYDTVPPPPYDDFKKSSTKTVEKYDEAGIYLGTNLVFFFLSKSNI